MKNLLFLSSLATFLCISCVPEAPIPAVVTSTNEPACETCTGIVTTEIGSGTDVAYSVIQQLDGKLVVAGYSYNGSTNDFAVVRYNSDGTLDTGFDNDGKVTVDIVDFLSLSDNAFSVVQQADGKLVVAGYTGFIDSSLALVRLNGDGTLDTSFGNDGKVTTDSALFYSWNVNIVQQQDGKLVVSSSSDNAFALVRFNSDGSLDASFDGDGMVTTYISLGPDRPNSLILQQDGKLVAAGSSENGSNADVVLVRYNNDGSLDSSFDSDGKVTTDLLLSSDDFANSVIQQQDGKLVIAGGTQTNGSFVDVALVRYNSDGSLDVSFDSDGKVITDIGLDDNYTYSVIQQQDGKLVIVGSSKSDFAMARYNSDGSLDTTFVGDAGLGDGTVITSIGLGNDQATSVIQQQDGKLVVAGYSFNGLNNDFAVVRYNTDGTLDTESFGPAP